MKSPVNFFLRRFLSKGLAIILAVAFVVTSLPVIDARAQEITALGLMPRPGTAVSLTSRFNLAYLKGMTIDPKDPFKFDFIVYRGDEQLSRQQKQEQYDKLIKYFLAAMAIPDKDQWVNLSPYEKKWIIPQDFGMTVMGRDLLAQDYLLKQLSSSLTNPDSRLGKEFWDEIYARVYKQFGTTQVPVNTFNKVWIVPDKAVIYEKGNTVYVLSDHLKVMTEEDYLSMKKHGMPQAPGGNTASMEISNQVMREVIIPAIEKEVNEGKNFAPLRQVFSGMLLATWYKRALKQSILSKIYADRKKVKGVDQDPKNNKRIYAQYVKAFKMGVFNMIKEDVDRLTHEVVPRKYFSGGTIGFVHIRFQHADAAMAVGDFVRNSSFMDIVTAKVAMTKDIMGKMFKRANKAAKITMAGIALVAGLGHSVQAANLVDASLQWSASPNPDIAGYYVEYGNEPGGPYPNMFNVGNINNFVIKGLMPGQEDYFVVKAHDSSGQEIGSSSEFNWVPPTVLDVTADPPNGQVSINFLWNQPVTNTDLTLEVANDINGPWTTQTNYSLSQNGNTYTISMPASQGNMFVRLAKQKPQFAASGLAVSPASSSTLNITSITSSPGKKNSQQTANNQLIASTNGVSLNTYSQFAWDPSTSSNIAGYNLYVSSDTNITTAGTSILSTATKFNVGNVTNATIGDLKPGQPIYVQATAYDANGNESVASNWVGWVPQPALNTVYPSVLTGQILSTFAWAKSLTIADVTVRVAAPGAPSTWYNLSGNYSFISNGDGTYTVYLPAGDFPAGVLVSVIVKSPAPNLGTVYPSDYLSGQVLYNFLGYNSLSRGDFTVDVAAPSAPSTWFALSGNYAVKPNGYFTNTNNNTMTISLPASDFPTNVLVKVPDLKYTSINASNGVPSTVSYPSDPTGQVVTSFSWASQTKLVSTNIIFQVAAPSNTNIWYTLSGNYFFSSNGSNTNTCSVSIPASGFPSGVLTRVIIKGSLPQTFTANPAMLTRTPTSTSSITNAPATTHDQMMRSDSRKGGIDLSQSALDMQIKRDGKGVLLPTSQQDLENVRIDGLVPVILDIKPVQGMTLFT